MRVQSNENTIRDREAQITPDGSDMQTRWNSTTNLREDDIIFKKKKARQPNSRVVHSAE